MQQTANYQLNQWQKQDRIMMSDFNADNQKLDAALAALERRMAGMICAWSGAADAIPAGWLLCDGSNGTPDLRGRFILGAGSSYAPGAAGGETSHTLSTAELPSHQHGYSVQARGSGSGAGDTVGYGNPCNFVATAKTTDSAGSSQPHNNMPPYYALCFVMYQGTV